MTNQVSTVVSSQPQLKIIDGQAFATSLDVAEKFGKHHQHVMEAVRKLDIPDNFRRSNFRQTSYVDQWNRKQPCYDMTRDGFTFLVMGFTGKDVAEWKIKYITAFNQMEKTLKTLSTRELLQNPDLLIGLAQELKAKDEQILHLEQQVEVDRPKVLFADSVAASKSSILVREMATILCQNGVPDMGEKKLYAKLRVEGLVVKEGRSDSNMPTQKAMNMKLFEIKETSITHSDGTITVNKTPKITGKGQAYFIKKYLGQNAVYMKGMVA